jgi:hypothetical protein
MNISRRATERVSLLSSSFHATWLSDWQKYDVTALLTNISPGGFGGLMNRAPAIGHLFHARLYLNASDGESASTPIEVDALLCRKLHAGNESNGGNTWVVHCAIESIHPNDKRHLMRVIGMNQPKDT